MLYTADPLPSQCTEGMPHLEANFTLLLKFLPHLHEVFLPRMPDKTSSSSSAYMHLYHYAGCSLSSCVAFWRESCAGKLVSFPDNISPWRGKRSWNKVTEKHYWNSPQSNLVECESACCKSVLTQGYRPPTIMHLHSIPLLIPRLLPMQILSHKNAWEEPGNETIAWLEHKCERSIMHIEY